jgi:hypothetical protein
MEDVVIFTSLGIRFWDAARDIRVDEGLVVRARPEDAPREVRQARVTRSGVYAFTGLHGLRDTEYPFPPAPVLGSPGPLPVRSFIVDVVDALGRFLPMAFRVDAPFLGVFPTGIVNGAPGDTPGFFLFSAPSRVTPAKLAGVRVSLVVAATDAPASHAVLEISLPDGGPVYALAGEDGQATAIFPYPPFAASLATPRTTEEARAPASWEIDVRVRYEPAGQGPLLPGLPPDAAELFQQAFVDVRPTAAGAPVDHVDASLAFGRDLVLRTDNQAHLLIG